MERKLFVIGIDPGYTACGLFVTTIEKQGSRGSLVPFLTDNIQPLALRPLHEKASVALKDATATAETMRTLLQTITHLKEQGDILAIFIELPHGGAKSARACRCLALATAVGSMLDALGYPIEWVDPMDSKRALTGNYLAKKPEMMGGMLRLFSRYIDLFPHRTVAGKKRIKTGEFEDIADAGATIVAGVRFQTALFQFVQMKVRSLGIVEIGL